MHKIITLRGTKLEVHDDGTIYSVPNPGAKRQLSRYKKKQSISGGYLQVGISGANNEGGGCRVHRLVAMAFCAGWDASLSVDHIDGNKTNNKVSNLRMVTVTENSRLYREEQDQVIARGGERPNGYKGVSKSGKKFMALVRVGKDRIYGGTFDEPIIAAIAVNRICCEQGLHLRKFNTPLMLNY
jgi:hypothetical protein